MVRTGIFGGSFNPIHNGHVALARQMLSAAGLDEVWLMVSPQNPLKQGDTALLADELRMQMARLAVDDEPGIVASDYELHLPRPSYTWNTLCQLSRDYPERTFTLLIGGDTWAHFERWRHWKDILRNYRVVAYPRGEHTGTIEAELLDVSSTEIRQRVKRGESISGLVPPRVEQFIRKERLYA